MVYVLIARFPYEGADVLGVYSNKDKAEKSKIECAKNDDSGGYNKFDIEEFDVE
tara:strand:+ start:126 stop:287 length:162 start_codon:yes stop_codon:yes gene_type:complete